MILKTWRNSWRKVAVLLLIGSIVGFLLHILHGFDQPFFFSTTAQLPEGMACPSEMVYIPGGTFRMGSDDPNFPEEKSAEGVTVDPFCMDRHEITNKEFAQFVAETGYMTVAERPLPEDKFPDLTEKERAPGSLVFYLVPEGQTVPELSWWQWMPGANWQHPGGPETSIAERGDYPVVHIALEDAIAYAKWAKKSLPTEAQWEFAARGGLRHATFVWGRRYSPTRANTWQGKFPWKNTQVDGYAGAAPVGSFPANGYGLYDMAGNVWEWTADWYRPGHLGKAHQHDPIVANSSESIDPGEPGVAKHVIKGGSYLCAPNYCSRYRPGAREAQAPDSGMSHLGFRLIAPVAQKAALAREGM